MDYSMPQGDGPEVCEQIRTLFHNIGLAKQAKQK